MSHEYGQGPEKADATKQNAPLPDFLEIRRTTEAICGPLKTDDYSIQPAAVASPPKWHLAHTSWFFEKFVLQTKLSSRDTRHYKPYHPLYHSLFNSDCESLSSGNLCRPTIEEVHAYRQHVNDGIAQLLKSTPEPPPQFFQGLHHEQRHQELLLMDILALFWSSPMRPVYDMTGASVVTTRKPQLSTAQAQVWEVPGGLYPIGTSDAGAFSFDNERPSHPVFVSEACLQTRLVTELEFQEFIDAGGYHDPRWWLSDGWELLRREHWEAPLYWEKTPDSGWRIFNLGGYHSPGANRSVAHVSYYEAHAFAKFRGKRLPLESEWEIAARSGLPHGELWEWTESAHLPYPGFRADPGALGESRVKFMCNQMVLRGSSFATPRGYARFTYRNFYPPAARWQFAGIRLAEPELASRIA